MKALRCTVVAVLAVAVLAFSAGTASASIRGLVLSAPKSVQVDYTHSTDANGNPLPTISVAGNVKNADGRVYNCQVTLNELNFTVASMTIAPGQTISWNVVTAYTGQNYLTFSLTCDGKSVPGQVSRVKIQQSATS